MFQVTEYALVDVLDRVVLVWYLYFFATITIADEIADPFGCWISCGMARISVRVRVILLGIAHGMSIRGLIFGVLFDLVLRSHDVGGTDCSFGRGNIREDCYVANTGIRVCPHRARRCVVLV
jgi:hypothetical protein